MAFRQTRVFVPSAEPLSDWAETLIGKVFRPLTGQFRGALDWYWFSRYIQAADDSGDCNIVAIPEEFKRPLEVGGGGLHRSMRFRFRVDDNQQDTFEERCRQLIDASGYCISDFRAYDFIRDTGSNRFLGVENRQPGRAEQRARLAIEFYHVISKLVIDALVGPDESGRFRFELNDDLNQNPRGSTFQSLLHLFCNITSVPTDVYVFQKANPNLLEYSTFIYPPDTPAGGWDSVTAVPIRY